MSEPFWTPLGGQPVDYEGPWAAGTQYAPGDVVVHNGINYLAVNPSLGSTPSPAAVAPGIGTSFPPAPVDGQRFILVDSLTAPTYAWEFVYVASISDAYKWVCLGGAPLIVEVATTEATASTSYVALATPGPILTIPRPGIYDIGVHHRSGSSGSEKGIMSYDIGATPAVDADAAINNIAGTNPLYPVYAETRKTFASVVALTAKYRTGAGSQTYANRRLMARPVRIS